MLTALLTMGLTLLVAAIFAHSGVSKLRYAHVYRDIVEGYAGRDVALPWVRLLGGAELTIALAMVLPASRSIAALLAALALAGYAALMAQQLRSDQARMRCGCGGVDSETRVAPELVVRNLLLAVSMAWLAGQYATSVPGAVYIAGAALGVLLMVCYASTDQLIANHQKMRGIR